MKIPERISHLPRIARGRNHGSLRDMKAAILCLTAISLIALRVSPAIADETVPLSKDKLITRVERVSPSLFSGVLGIERADSSRKPLPQTADGKQRWDVSNFFSDRGVVPHPGGEAIFLEHESVLVVTNTPEQIDLVQRILMTCDGPDEVLQIEVDASLWDYDATPENENAQRPLRLAELKKAAGNSLSRSHSISLMTRSGNRSVVVSKQGSAGASPAAVEKPAKDAIDSAAALLGSSKGAAFIVEPVIGPDSKTVDMQFDYSVRLPRDNNLPDFEINYITNISVVDGQNMIVQTASVQSEQRKPRQAALVISARIVKADERSVEQRKRDYERERAPWVDAMIKKARAGLPEKK